MKKRALVLMILMLAFTMFLSACGSGTKEGTDTNAKSQPAATDTKTDTKQDQSTDSGNATDQTQAKEDDTPDDLSGSLEVWTFDENDTKQLAAAFMAKYPNVKIDVKTQGWNDLPKNLQTTIAAGSGAPDVAYIAGNMFTPLMDGDGLVDLLQPPYDAGRYKGDFPEKHWEHWMSHDGKRLTGMPWDMPPNITFYRADLIDKAGFPSDPKDFGEFIKDPDNVFQLAAALKSQGIYTFEFNKTPVDILTANTGFFDKDLNYLRNNDQFVQALDMAKKVKQLGYGMEKSAVWSDDGKALTSQGKVAMLFYGPWYAGGLQALGDDQVGKWKISNLPFGLNEASSGSTMVIPSQSKNKQLAWAFIRFSLATEEGNEMMLKNGIIPGYLPVWKSDAVNNVKMPLVGDQNAGQMIASIMAKSDTNSIMWPIDDAAQKIWDDGINNAIAKNTDSKAALQQIQDDIMKAVKVDYDALKAKYVTK